MATFTLQNTTLKVLGRIPSKKNSKRPFIRNGRMMIFSSKDYVAWHKEASKQLEGIFTYPIFKCEKIILTFYGKDLRAWDLSNKCESIMDLLVDCKILHDDNYNVVPELTLKYGGIDKENPRCEIEIEWFG